MNSKSSYKNSYFDLEIISKFESLEEYPKTKPLLLANISGIVLYANKPLQENYEIHIGDNLFELKTEPRFEKLLKSLVNKDVYSFCSNLLIEKKEKRYFESYLLDVERIEINDEKLFIVYLDSEDNRNQISKKINSYNQALESVNVGVLIADENASIKYTSTSFEKFLNIKIENVYNKNLLTAFQKYLSEHELNDLGLSILEKKPWVKVISEINNSGDVLYKEIRLNAIVDNTDQSTNYIVTVNDITKHIQQTRLIKKSEQRQKSIINNISDPIIILRKEKGNLLIENANTAFFEDILGNKNEPSENGLLEIISPILHSIIHESIINLDDSNRIHSQFHYTAPISSKRFLGKVTFTDDKYDNTRLYIINMTDITEQLEIERRLREAYKKEISLNKLKSTFLANMSHEIRTPLNAIVGYSDLLEDDVKQMNYESSAKMTSYLKEGVNRLLKLVDNIVEVSLLESGNQEIKMDMISLNKLIEQNKDSWETQAKLKNIKVNFHLNQTELFINADEEKLQKVFEEIIDNSIKYNNDGGEIKILTFLDKDNTVLQIADTGIGIERDSLHKILQLFEQVEEVGYTRKYEGAGLGLSLANKLITYMNGEMQILSKPNSGTIVTIYFPTP